MTPSLQRRPGRPVDPLDVVKSARAEVDEANKALTAALKHARNRGASVAQMARASGLPAHQVEHRLRS